MEKSEKSIKNKFFSGVFWSFMQNIAIKVFSFVFMIILTRLLTPSDYGLIGMLSIFISISTVFISSGFGEALVQKQNCSDDDYSTAFYFNLIIATFIYLILFLGAPLIASFYREPQLVPLTRVLALNFVLGAFNIVQQSKLTKSMEFKTLAIISLICTVLGGIAGVVLAYNGFGVWALVFQTLIATFSRLVLFPFFTRWHPNRPFNVNSFRSLWQYGSRLLVTGVLGVVINNLSGVLIGRFYDKQQVGYYDRAQNIAAMPSESILSVLSSVTFPTLCAYQEDTNQRLDVYKRVLFNAILIVGPIIFLIALLAEPIVIILFTEKWAPCIPLLQVLLMARLFVPIGAIHTVLLRSYGDTTLYMKLYFITGPISLLAILVSIPYGVIAMAWATFIGSLFAYSIPAYVIGRKFGYPLFKQLWDCRKVFISLLIMSIGVYCIKGMFINIWMQLIVGGITGMVIFFLCCIKFQLIDSDIKQLFFSLIKQRKNNGDV